MLQYSGEVTGPSWPSCLLIVRPTVLSELVVKVTDFGLACLNQVFVKGFTAAYLLSS